MAAVVKLLSASLVILSLLNGAMAQCTLSDISVHQSPTGFSIHGKTEYEVVVSNNCICSQSSLLLACQGFQSTLSVDPGIFRKDGSSNCSVNGGQPVFQGSPIEFKYAWVQGFKFKPVGSTINCS